MLKRFMWIGRIVSMARKSLIRIQSDRKRSNCEGRQPIDGKIVQLHISEKSVNLRCWTWCVCVGSRLHEFKLRDMFHSWCRQETFSLRTSGDIIFTIKCNASNWSLLRLACIWELLVAEHRLLDIFSSHFLARLTAKRNKRSFSTGQRSSKKKTRDEKINSRDAIKFAMNEFIKSKLGRKATTKK